LPSYYSIEIFDKDISKINEINEIYLRVESEQKRLSDKMEDINKMHGDVQPRIFDLCQILFQVFH
jgi:hypothetical protein